MARQSEMSSNWLIGLLLTRLSSTAHVGGKSVGEGACYSIPTLPNISWHHVATFASILVTDEKIHSLVSAGDGGGDGNGLLSNRAGVGGDDTRICVLAQCAVTSTSTLFKTNWFWSSLTTAGWYLSSDQDVSYIFGTSV